MNEMEAAELTLGSNAPVMHLLFPLFPAGSRTPPPSAHNGEVLGRLPDAVPGGSG